MGKIPTSVRLSLIALITVNLSTILGITFLGWSSGFILMGYWIESLVVGFYTILKMNKASKMGQIKATVNDKPVKLKKPAIIRFFILHYGIFMLGHLMFVVTILIAGSDLGDIFNLIPWLPVFFIGLMISHGISYKQNFIGNEEYLNKTVSQVMIDPYKRIIPMHLAILFGFLFASPAILLVLIKTTVDVYSHLHERRK
jgi:hypothetical protein